MVTPLRSTVDLERGGRWTSLRRGDREWLWHRADPARAEVRPGQAFVDAGGLEECIPTVRGKPDHGDAWSRPWGPDGVTTADFRLSRTIRHTGGAVVADYRLVAAPGWRFIWAAHALLDLSVGARLVTPAPPRGVDPALLSFGPDDGTAVGAILDCPAVSVVDGPDTLSFQLSAPGQPVSTALWRNLGGFPQPDPYRSIGVEPMLGKVFDLQEAGPDDAAVVPASGECSWRLTLS
jgi:hypothetical protein